MFYYASKIFWLLAQPVSAAAILVGFSLLLTAISWRRSAAATGTLAFLILGLSIWTNVGAVALQPLENRFRKPDQAPERVDGIIVLGGAFEGRVSGERGQPELNEGGDRMTEAAALALRYPQAKLLISGAGGTLIDDAPGDGELGADFLAPLGIDRARVLAENVARNTQENIALSRELAQPKPGETWLLVTSAFHMPRSVGLFRKAGWEVVPWPADYRAPGNERLGFCRDDSMRCLRQTTAAVREWIGLATYRLTGRIDAVFPAP